MQPSSAWRRSCKASRSTKSPTTMPIPRPGGRRICFPAVERRPWPVRRECMREGVGDVVQPDSSIGEDGGAGRPVLSVIVPLFNEQDVVEILHRRLVTVLGGIADLDLEFVYVDDGSRDETPARLAQLAAADPRICAVTLSRNFGQQA